MKILSHQMGPWRWSHGAREYYLIQAVGAKFFFKTTKQKSEKEERREARRKEGLGGHSLTGSGPIRRLGLSGPDARCPSPQRGDPEKSLDFPTRTSGSSFA